MGPASCQGGCHRAVCAALRGRAAGVAGGRGRRRPAAPALPVDRRAVGGNPQVGDPLPVRGEGLRGSRGAAARHSVTARPTAH